MTNDKSLAGPGAHHTGRELRFLSSQGQLILTIRADDRIDIGAALSDAEAARGFIECLRFLAPHYFVGDPQRSVTQHVFDHFAGFIGQGRSAIVGLRNLRSLLGVLEDDLGFADTEDQREQLRATADMFALREPGA